MRQITTDPRRIILWHHQRSKPNIRELVRDPVWFRDHPVQVVAAPLELSELGDYIAGEGHNRTVAALEYGITAVPITIIENDSDAQENFGDGVTFSEVYDNAVNLVVHEVCRREDVLELLNKLRTLSYKRRSNKAA